MQKLLLHKVNPVVMVCPGDYLTLEKRREDPICNLVKKCLLNRCPQFFCTVFITTRMYCAEEQGALINLDPRL